MIVCIEAGSGIDQAIMKTSDELDITYPALAEEMRLVTTEMRAGKPRLEAFKNFASRTKVDEVRSLVSMLVQTDRFGTSVAQALRTHADVSRTKRRQNAEERAGKIGVKLVFPARLLPVPGLVCGHSGSGSRASTSGSSNRMWSSAVGSFRRTRQMAMSGTNIVLIVIAGVFLVLYLLAPSDAAGPRRRLARRAARCL